MTPTIVKTYYSAAELAAFEISCLPSTERGIKLAAQRNRWAFRARSGRGGGVEYSLNSLPSKAQAEIKSKAVQTIVSTPMQPFERPVRSGVAGVQQALPGLTEQERFVADARKGVLLALSRIRAGAGCSQDAAIATLLMQAAAGQVEPHLLAMLKAARTARGRKSESGLPSERTLMRWLALDRSNDLAPKKVQPDMTVPKWAAAFLSHYSLPQKPSVEAAYRNFIAAPHGEETPSIYQVRRFLSKMGNVSREIGRKGSREIKNIMPFVRRDFSALLPGDIYSADGHCFDAEVRHPLTGKAFRPELTSIIDIATRKCVGFSVDLAESGLAVVDALRHAVVQSGVPAIFYVDNGSGYVNNMLGNEATGLMARFGIDMRHSIAYNSQARGVIERFHQMWVAAAKTLDSYMGADMDREARQNQFKLTRKAIKQGGAVPMMAWPDFVAWCHHKVAEYNARPHRSLGGKSPDQRWAELLPQSSPVIPTQAEAEHLFKPQVSRKVQRCELQLFGNNYFSSALEEFHGDPVRVAYDIHDAKWVWVYDREGRFLCKAEWNGNQQAYYAKPVVDMARERRENARKKRHELHIADIEEAKRTPLAGELTYQPATNLTQKMAGRLATEAKGAQVIEAELITPSQPARVTAMQDLARPMFHKTADRYRWLMAHQGAWSEVDRTWLGNYVASDEYAERADVYEFEGIAWQSRALSEAVG